MPSSRGSDPKAARSGRPLWLQALASVAPLAGAALISVGAVGSIPHDGLHPLALMASLLPLQLAALLYVFARSPG
jgi:hypothetical protein